MNPYICPHCHNPVFDEDALLCHFCGQSLNRATNGFLSNLRYSNKRVAWVFLVFLVLAAFAFLFIR